MKIEVSALEPTKRFGEWGLALQPRGLPKAAPRVHAAHPAHTEVHNPGAPALWPEWEETVPSAGRETPKPGERVQRGVCRSFSHFSQRIRQSPANPPGKSGLRGKGERRLVEYCNGAPAAWKQDKCPPNTQKSQVWFSGKSRCRP